MGPSWPAKTYNGWVLTKQQEREKREQQEAKAMIAAVIDDLSVRITVLERRLESIQKKLP